MIVINSLCLSLTVLSLIFSLSFRKPKPWRNIATFSVQNRTQPNALAWSEPTSQYIRGSPRNLLAAMVRCAWSYLPSHSNVQLNVKTTHVYLHGPDIFGLCLIFSFSFCFAWIDLTNTLKKISKYRTSLCAMTKVFLSMCLMLLVSELA